MTEKLIKLTDENKHTHGKTLWGTGVTHTARSPRGVPKLCTDEVIHAYRCIELGLLLNTIHANYLNPIAWECDGEIVAEDWGKVGCSTLTTLRQIPLPTWYQDEKQRTKIQILFAVLCAESVLHFYTDYNPTDDRPAKAIAAAKNYLKQINKKAARAAWAAAREAGEAAGEAARAAWAAGEAGEAAGAAWAAAGAAWAAAGEAGEAAGEAGEAAGEAARAAWAARAAGEAAREAGEAARAEKINFVTLAQKAVKITMEDKNHD